jgi:hypothetical protein
MIRVYMGGVSVSHFLAVDGMNLRTPSAEHWANGADLLGLVFCA